MEMRTRCQVIVCFLLAHLLGSASPAVIQALIDFDDNSEDLIGSLIQRVDHIVDPVKDDMTNVSLSLAHALLKLGPVVSIIGNVSDGTNNISITFSFSATTSNYSPSPIIKQSQKEEGEYDWKESRGGGILAPVVGMVEPWILFILEIAAHSILGVIITQILQATTLLENVPFA